jgi:outer membrane murein-binding lipoprotein Lpp
MRLCYSLLAVMCCVLATGCDSAKIKELTKQVEQLRTENERLTGELQAVQKSRDELQAKVAGAEEIRRGYEEARTKFQAQVAGVSAAVGAAVPNPLPPFDELKDSEWVGKLLPGAAANLGNLKELKEVQDELLQGILGGQKETPK